MIALEQKTNLNIRMMMQNTYDTFNELSLKRMVDLVAGFAVDNIEFMLGRIATSQLTNSAIGSRRGDGVGTDESRQNQPREASLDSVKATKPQVVVSGSPGADKRNNLKAGMSLDKLNINVKKLPSLKVSPAQ